MNRTSFTLEGAQINSAAEFHSQLARILDSHEYHGKNLDAMLEVLTDLVQYGDPEKNGFKIIWRDHEVSRQRLGIEYDKIVSVLNDVSRRFPSFKLELV